MVEAELSPITITSSLTLPAILDHESDRARTRFVEFFAVTIRNANTRLSYARAVSQFLDWCGARGATLATITPMLVAAYVEQLTQARAPQTVKQHLAAIRMLLDWLVTGQIIPMNPASSVRGPRYSIKQGKTSVLSAADTRKLLDSIDARSVIGLRDRAIIGVMVYSFARVSAVLGMSVRDYHASGKRYKLRLHEKGGKYHEIPVHHTAEEYLDAYIEAAGIADEKKSPLFRSLDAKTKRLSDRGLDRHEAHKMIKRRARAARLPDDITCHTFRATGITTYLENGGTIEHAQQIAAHESPRTTKLYDRTTDVINLDEIERVRI